MSEVLEGDIEQPAPDMKRAALPSGGGYAVDGALVPGPVVTGGQLIDILEDGNFSADLAVKLKDLAADMQDINKATGKAAKGKVNITLALSFEDGMFKVQPEMKVTAPTLPREKSVLWVNEHNQFTRFPPNQGQFFGMRSAGGSGEMRRI